MYINRQKFRYDKQHKFIVLNISINNFTWHQFGTWYLMNTTTTAVSPDHQSIGIE